jgi:SpoVK/Ycf46/Vps4 family AAA+-type ATPase
LLEWFQRETHEVPEISRKLEKDFSELLGENISVPANAAYPWNTRGKNPARVPSWFSKLLNSDDDLVEDWIKSGALLPSPEEMVLVELSRQFNSSASWVFLLHGNVRDYLFDANLGYAPLSDVIESYWLNTCLFGDHPQAVAIRYSLSTGVSLPQVTKGGSHEKKISEDIRSHNEAVKRCAHEDRILQDFVFLSNLLQDCSHPPMLIYFERPGLLFPPGSEWFRTAHCVEHVLRWASQAPKNPHHLVILAADTPDELNPEFRKRVNGIIQLEVPRPSRTLDRRRFLIACLAACNASPVEMILTRLRSRLSQLPWSVSEVGRFAEATAGLSYTGIETCILNILENEVGSDDEALRYIKKQRSELLRAESEGLLEIIEPTHGLDALVGGLDAVRDRLRFIVRSMSDDNARTTQTLAPMGVLFVGPPGTGKSLTAEALAAECAKAGVHYVKMGDFRDMWVGQSERNFSRILKLLETFGKVIVFMDEIDQTEGGARVQGGQHETSRRIFGKLLEFMANQEHRGRILWIAATNMPGSIDPALLRPGRFDLILPFEPPDAAGCRKILDLHLGRHSVDAEISELLLEIAEKMEKEQFTGAEIQLIVTEAARRAFTEQRTAIKGADLEAAFNDYTASPKNTKEYQQMVEDCRRFIPFKSLQRTSS